MMRAWMRGLSEWGAYRKTMEIQAVGNYRIVRGKMKIRKMIAEAKRRQAGASNEDEDSARLFKHGWRIATATILERVPIVTPEVSPIEKAWRDRAFELRNIHGKPIPDEVLTMEIPGGGDPMAKMKEEVEFTPASRVTEADRTNDRKSLNRRLDKKLYFILRRTETSAWQFPQRIARESETMRQSAEMALQVIVGTEPWTYFIGNAPIAHLVHVYPEAYQKENDVYGVKIFFYRSNLIEGKVDSIRQGHDFLWVTKDEIDEYFGTEYLAAVRRALVS
mmetsp:Transcript_6187/g.12135  ORF Transcript_6187/g.12135 Transcript_6187/m.12135 type:complete len:277 (-) Transcript_6187:1092-1922(-)